MISDIRDSLQQSGIAKLVIVNAHGGNYAVRNIVQESNVSGIHVALFPTSADWARARAHAGMSTNDHEDMHAGELETSILLHFYPSVVRDGYEQADHIADDRSGLLTLGMKGYTESGVIGRPSHASSAKGKAGIESLVQSFATCLTTLAS